MRREDLTHRLNRNHVWFSNNCVGGKRLMADLHWHDAFEILYVRSGIAEQQINVDRFTIIAGDVVIIRAGDLHLTESISENGCDIDYVQFTSDLLPDFEQILNNISSKVIHYEDKIRDIFNGLGQTKDSKEPGKEFLQGGLIYMLCGIIVNTGDFKQKHYPSVLNKICKYIEESSDIRLETVSSYFNYSMEHISRIFRRELGVSYRDYCNRVKMKKATSLLSNTDISTTEIALTLGYSNESSFIRAFKRMYGITPNVFRHKQHVLSLNR